MRLTTVILAIIFLLMAKYSFGQYAVIINEFLIEPTPQQVELLNLSNQEIDISNWHLDDSSGSTFYTIADNTVIGPNSCLIFQTDLNLNRTSADTLRLFDSTAPPTSISAQLIDSFSYKSSSGSGVSYQRLPDGGAEWATGSANLGLFNQSGESCIFVPEPTPTTIVTEEITPTTTANPTPLIPTATPTAAPISYENIFITEVMVYPEKDSQEWIELFNNNEFTVILTNWFIDDLENAGSSPKQFSLTIPAKGYAVYDLSSMIFNNDRDSIRLLDFNTSLKDDFEYSSSTQGTTLGRITVESDEFCQQQPSKSNPNNPCNQLTPLPTPTSKVTPTGKTVPSVTKASVTNSSTALIPQPTFRSAGSFNQLNQTTGFLPISLKESLTTDGQVLGSHTMNIDHNQQNKAALSKSLSFSSFSFSTLSIISVLLKLKNSLG